MKYKIPDGIKEIMMAKPNIGRYALSKEAGISESDARFYTKLFKEDKDNKVVKRGIAVGDIHFPDHDEGSLNILFKFIKDFDPDYLLLTGDQMDMGCISSFNRSKPKLTEGKRLKREYKGFQTKVLDVLADISPESKKYFFIGNHEYRTQWLIEQSPQYEGFIEPENNLKLDDYTIVPFNEAMNLGEMYFIHGNYYNKYHSEKNVRIYGKHIFNWHVHTNQIYTMHSPINHLPRQGVSVGCMCNKNPEYKRNQPNHWVNQFIFFYMYGNGQFSYYTPIILNNRCVINGKLYDGN